ncbi:MAG TPA: hypothetical protein VJ884_04730 [Salinibacter sp.]|nr:hypothetical protein [Salinibacter sp.]
MIRYRTQERAPHLLFELTGKVAGKDVRQELADLPEVLASLPSDFVVLAVYPEVILFEADAIGPLFYFITHIFDADPGLCVFVDGGQSLHPGLRAFIEKIGLEEQVAFVPSREEADVRIRAFVQSRE